MVVIAYKEEETVIIEDVTFINDHQTETSILTKDGVSTDVSCAEGTELSVFTDNGVKIFPEPTTK